MADAQDNPDWPDDVFYDPWRWVVIYPNGAEYGEYDEITRAHRRFSDYLPENTADLRIALIPAYPERYPGLQPVVVLIPAGARPIVFRSRAATLILNPDAPIPEHHRITGVGWQKTIGGRIRQVLLALYDDGSMILTDDRGRV